VEHEPRELAVALDPRIDRERERVEVLLAEPSVGPATIPSVNEAPAFTSAVRGEIVRPGRRVHDHRLRQSLRPLELPRRRRGQHLRRMLVLQAGILRLRTGPVRMVLAIA